MKDLSEFNRIAMKCNGHRMVITQSESVYKKYDYQQIVPEKEIITYQCVGECKQQLIQTITPKQ